MLTEAELLELERLEREATPACEWEPSFESYHDADGYIHAARGPEHHTKGLAGEQRARVDAALIVSARNALPLLLAAARERDELRRQVDAIRKLVDKPPRNLLVSVGVLRHIISATQPKGEP